jgi:hypothetical protein
MASHHQPANDAAALSLRDALRFSLVIEAEQQQRHAWLATAAEQIKRRATGVAWTQIYEALA